MAAVLRRSIGALEMGGGLVCCCLVCLVLLSFCFVLFCLSVCLLLVVIYSLLLFIVCRFLLGVCLLFVVCCLLLLASCLLFVACCLFVIVCFRLLLFAVEAIILQHKLWLMKLRHATPFMYYVFTTMMTLMSTNPKRKLIGKSLDFCGCLLSSPVSLCLLYLFFQSCIKN